MTFPNGGEGGPRLGKNSHIFPFFLLGSVPYEQQKLGTNICNETFERFKTNTWENVYELKKTRSLDPKNKDHSLRYLRFITILFCDCKKRLSLLLKLLSHQGENFQWEIIISLDIMAPFSAHTRVQHSSRILRWSREIVRALWDAQGAEVSAASYSPHTKA